MDRSDLKDWSVGPTKIEASGPSEYILGDALDSVPGDNFGSCEELKESMSKWFLNTKEDDKDALAELVAQVTNEGNCRKRFKQEDTINQNPKEDDKSAVADLVAQIINEGNCSQWFKQEEAIKQEEPDNVTYPSETYFPSTYATKDLVQFVKEEPDDVTYPSESFVPSSYATLAQVPFVKDLKSLQCMMQEDPQEVATKIPTRGKTLKATTEIQKATAKEEKTKMIRFLDKGTRTLLCSSSSREKSTDTAQGSDTLWGESKGNQDTKEEFKNCKYVCDLCGNKFTIKSSLTRHKQSRCSFLKSFSSIPTVKQKELIYTNMSDYKENESDSKLFNSPMTLLNKRQQAVAKTDSLPQTSVNTTVDPWQTDNKRLSDDNREDDALDPSESCSGDIACLCSQCRPKSNRVRPSKLKKSCKYVCDLCGNKFTRKYSLTRHKQSRCSFLSSSLPKVKQEEFIEKSMPDSKENASDLKSCNNSENMTLNERQQAVEKNESLPQTSDNTTVDTRQTDNESLSDDNREDDVLDPSESCRGDILCLCSQCRRKRQSVRPSKFKQSSKYVCNLCGNKFTFRTSLWRHKKSRCSFLSSSLPKVKQEEFIEKSMPDSKENASDLKSCNKSENMTLNERQQAVEKNESLPQTSDNTTVDTWQTDNESLSDDNREDDVLDPSESCRGDISCLCSQCRRKRQSVRPSKFKQSSKYVCNLCGNKFTFRTSLWRHKKSSCSVLKLSSSLPTVKQKELIDKSMADSKENGCDSKSYNSPENMTLLNKIQQAAARTDSLPQTSDNTTVYTRQTDNERLSDDNREDDVLDPSKSCSGDIFCLCSQCRPKSHSVHPSKLNTFCKYVCDLCGTKFTRKDSLKTHNNTKCGFLKLFSCDVCCRGYTSKHTLVNHIRTDHGTEAKKTVKCNYKCDICQETLASKRGLRSHQEGHLINKSTCNFCGKVFSSKRNLQQHVFRQHNNKRVECAHCSKMFKTKWELIYHIQHHHKGATLEFLKCTECKLSFATKEGLQKHLFQHPSLSTKFVCEYCAQSFHSNSGLKQHLLIHTNEKPFVCDTCGKCFRTESNLHQHSVTHSDKRPFACDVCDKSFRIKHHLRQHMAVHGMVNTSSARSRKK